MLIIGELINATRKKVKDAVIHKKGEHLQELAQRQDQAGAHYIDVNVATGGGNPQQEGQDMTWAVTVIKEVTQKPLAIDTASLIALEAGLKAHGPGAIVNSISAEEGRLEPFLHLAGQYDCLVIALPVGEEGIPKDLLSRIKLSQKILSAAEKAGLAADRLYFDPLAFPLGVDDQSGLLTLEVIHALKEELGVKTTMGLSNISHGLPRRSLLNRTYLTLALHKGLDSAIMDPLDKGVMSAFFAAQAALGRDPYCSGFLRAFRQGRLQE